MKATAAANTNDARTTLQILVAYESKYGQTQKIAGFIADLLRPCPGNRQPAAAVVTAVRVLHIDNVEANDIRQADAVIVVSPVYFSNVAKTTRAFVLQNLPDLARCPTTALFTVSSKGGSSAPSDRSEATRIANDFLRATQWQPNEIATFGGALAYPKYNVFLRFLAKTMAKKLGASTDTSRIHESTNWDEVSDATERFLAIAVQVASLTHDMHRHAAFA